MKAFAMLGPLALALAVLTPQAHAQSSIDDLLLRVGDRVAEFYQRAKNLICTETYVVQPIDARWALQGFARTVESELRIEIGEDQAPGAAEVVRQIRRVNGRAPREEDKTSRAGCTDPLPLSSDPLAFLLPSSRADYQFKVAGTADEGGRSALRIDFSSVNRRSNPELVEDPGGHEDCFDWSGHIAARGRIWIDAENHDVLRLERGLPGPVDVRVPILLQRRYRFENWVTIERDDLEIRYETVAFSDPDETLLLPASIVSLTIVRGGLQSTRRTHTFSDYKRFVTEGRVVAWTPTTPSDGSTGVP